MQLEKNTKLIHRVLLLILVINVFTVFNMGAYKSAVSTGDACGLYGYLPAFFIEQDFEFIRELLGSVKDYSGAQSGAFVNKYTSGVAMLQSPFFGVGHLMAKVLGEPQDGYSYPYIVALVFSIQFYVFMGLLLLSKVLKQYFEPSVVVTVLIILALATNLYYFTNLNNQMSHGYLFFLYALLIYATEKWYAAPSWMMAMGIGFSGGLLTIIRPTDILAMVIPVFYGLSNWQSVRLRISVFKKYWLHLLLAVFFFVLASVPQLLYWKTVAGEWIYYSYRDEGFDFTNPHIWAGLTDGKNGWLRYTPIMVFALLGIGFLFKKRTWLWPILFFFPVYIFVIYSWHNWFYINSFGSRPMVGTYALLAFPLGYFVSYAFAKKWSRIGFLVLTIFFLGLNIFQTYQERWGVSRSEYASNAYYWKIFGKTKMDYSMLSTFESNINQPRKTKVLSTIYENRIADTTQTQLDFENYHSPPASMRLNHENAALRMVTKPLGDLGVKSGQYLKISGWFYTEEVVSWWDSAVLLGYIDQNGETTNWRTIWIQNKIAAEKSDFSLWGHQTNVWGEVYFYYLIPKGLAPNDVLHLEVVNGHASTVWIDDLKVEVCERL